MVLKEEGQQHFEGTPKGRSGPSVHQEILRQHSQSCGHEGPVRPESRRSERAEELLFRWDKDAWEGAAG